MPLALASPPPHAYVIEYRPLDRCAPPSCAFKSRDLFGWADELQPDGEPGRTVQFGRHGDYPFDEMYFHRGVVLGEKEELAFELPASDAPSELDVYLSAQEEEEDFHARITFEEAPPAAPARVLESHAFDGHTAWVGEPPDPEDQARERNVFDHVRLPLPSRAHRSIRVRIVNAGDRGLGVGSPLVMKRIEGRGPRQLQFAILDAVPYPLAQALFGGRTGDAPSEWLPAWVRDRGHFFPGGLTPGLQTSSFCWRFFRPGFYDIVGEPLIRTDLHEAPPAHAHDVITRFAEQGVMTFMIGANFALTPGFTYAGWDGGYDSDGPDHANAIVTRYREWLDEHPHDDAFVVTWFANTHAPWPQTRIVDSDAPLPPDLPSWKAQNGVLYMTWANALVAAERLKEMREAATAADPSATRLTYLAADHGRAFTERADHRAFRTGLGDVMAGGLSHGVAASAEEDRTPFVLVLEGPEPRVPSLTHAPPVVKGDVSTLAALRAFEAFFQVDLHVPDVRAFDAPVFSGAAAFAARWDDELLAGVGSAHTWRFVRGNWAYSMYEPRFDVTEIWDQPASVQRMLRGTPFSSGRVRAEELYDRTEDPLEEDNVAGEHFDEVLELRRRAVDWLATYWDGAGHPRNRYALTFPARTEAVITAARPFEARVDGVRARHRTPRSIEMNGTRVEIEEQEYPAGVIEIGGDIARAPITLRCASNGLPVDVTTPARPRLNLALARTNCPTKKSDHVVAMAGSVMFSFEEMQPKP